MKKLGFIIICWLSLNISFGQELELAQQYFEDEEYEKAIELYQELAKNPNNHVVIHKNYLEALTKTNQSKETERYLKQGIRRNPDNPQFNVDYGIFLIRQRRKKDAEAHFETFMGRIQRDDSKIRYTARKFINEDLYNYAERLYLAGQERKQTDFSFELANLYAISGKIEKMIETYLRILEVYPQRLEYIQGILQTRIRDEATFTKMENTLFRYVQKNPELIVYNEMLVWFYIQQKNFKKAFLQARAIDRRKQLAGSQLYEIGELALQNQEYEMAIRVFEYLTEKYQYKGIYPRAKRRLVNAKEQLVKNTFPVEITKIRSLASDYQQVIDELGLVRYTADAARSLALLQAFYLDNRDTAIVILKTLTQTQGIDKKLIATAKLDMGDIFILKNEPWESSLLYSQVEKAQKNTNLGHLAKLKNAKLAYYQGEFELSKAHLDILKLATSREIANDAMNLSLLIGDNLALDTSDTALKQYAEIDLMVFQGKYTQALENYEEMLKSFKGHSLTDEIYWQEANLYLKLGKFDRVIYYLQKIMTNYGNDIYADDANFMLGKVYEENLKDKEKAMKYYEDQIVNFPGSVHTAEARKRFRILRGDAIN